MGRFSCTTAGLVSGMPDRGTAPAGSASVEVDLCGLGLGPRVDRRLTLLLGGVAVVGGAPWVRRGSLAGFWPAGGRGSGAGLYVLVAGRRSQNCIRRAWGEQGSKG